MGQTQSRVGDDSQPEERIESGVRVTMDLLHQLSGNPKSRASSPTRTPSTAEPPSEEESIVILKRDPLLVDALRQSRRLGDLLLKNEERELAQVNQLVDDLLNQEYRCAAS
ncbi:hypothetical protein WJX75_001794 [Coccomyxa subellipsoidea]|uniref:GAT domain-containing protein n=1 Tax=Coccomyxa subellipsoidea TaxID=248742 RepID=A0ABR2YIY8_9CHLO